MIGLFLVAVMPTTMNSGVIMTGASGGNPAQALIVCVLHHLVPLLVDGFLVGRMGRSATVQ